MKDHVPIRAATLEDLDTVVQLRLDFLTDVGKITCQSERDVMYRRCRDYFSRLMPSGDVRVWLAGIDNRPACIGAMVVFKRPPVGVDVGGDEAYVFNIYTPPDFRRQGLAAAMTEHIIRECAALGFTRARLHASEEGARVYKRLGFEVRTDEMELKLANRR